MKKYLLPKSGHFYKANLHCHSVHSDGRLTPNELKDLYISMGYSVIAFTDHDILLSHEELADENFLPLNGFELEVNETGKAPSETKTCHICFIGLDKDNIIQPFWNENYLFGNAVKYKDMVRFDETGPDYVRNYNGKLISEMMRTGVEKGFFVTYNHPTWSLESYNEYINYSGMNAVEIVNYGCQTEGYDDYNPRVYDDLLRNGVRLFAIASDDNHNRFPNGNRHCDSGGGFVMIKVDKLEYSCVASALKKGDFYASEGPEIFDLWIDGDIIHITCSPADSITLSTDCRISSSLYAQRDSAITSGEFDFPNNCKYFRLTVKDGNGRHANTNAYFIDSL